MERSFTPNQRFRRRLADGFTLARAVGGVMLAFYTVRGHPRSWSEATARAVVGLTDFVDGKLTYDCATEAGAKADQLVDKLYNHTIGAADVVRDGDVNLTKAACQATVLGRDIGVTRMRHKAEEKSIDVSAQNHGKVKASAQFITQTLEASPLADHYPRLMSSLHIGCAALSLASGMKYRRAFRSKSSKTA